MTDTVGGRVSSSVWSPGVIARPGLLLGGALVIGLVGEMLLHGQAPCRG